MRGNFTSLFALLSVHLNSSLATQSTQPRHSFRATRGAEAADDEVGELELTLSEVKEEESERTMLIKYRGKATIEGQHEVLYWRSMSVKVRVKKIPGPRISRVVVRPDMHPALDDLAPSASFEALREEVKRSRKLRGIVVGRTGRLASMMGGRTLSSDPAYLAHVAGDDLSDSDDDQSVGARSVLSSHGRRAASWDGGLGDEAGAILPFWGSGEGGELSFDTSSDFFTAIAEVVNLQSRDILVWNEDKEEEKEVIVAGGSSRILVEVKRVSGVEDYVALQEHLSSIDVLRWRECAGGGVDACGSLRFSEDVVHELFEDDNDMIKRVSSLGLQVDVSFVGEETGAAVKIGEWIGVSSTVKVDGNTASMLRDLKMGAGVCEWICEGEDKEEALWAGRMLRKFDVGGGGGGGGGGGRGGNSNTILEHNILAGFAKEGRYKLRVAVTFGGAEAMGGGSVFFSNFLTVKVSS